MSQNYPWSASSNAVTSNANMLTASALNAALSAVGDALIQNEWQSEMKFGEDSFVKFTAPPPNWLRRLIWRVALGVVWKDLRPERALEELAKLK